MRLAKEFGVAGWIDKTKYVDGWLPIDTGRVDDTYCVNEPKRHMVMFNGILTGQCEEIHLPTKGVKNSGKLYEYSEDIVTGKQIGRAHV